MARWRDETPGSFRFTMKLGKVITHNKDLYFDPAVLAKYMRVFNAIGGKKGCLLIQFPAGTKAGNFNQLKSLLANINDLNNGWKLAVEFRDHSWYNDKVFALLESNHALLVEHDMPASATPDLIPGSDTRFFRFHGINGDYRGSYSPEILQNYLIKMQHAVVNHQDVYAYFNNTMGEAVHNALTLQREFNSMYHVGEYT